MIKEILHFVLHAPQTVILQHRLSQAELYDTLMQRSEERGIAEWRSSLARDVDGVGLEIGCGTGLMFRHYKKGQRIVAMELESEFLTFARNRSDTSDAGISLAHADAQFLPFAEKVFDYIIIALVLCSVKSVQKVLEEVKRVLKKNGEVRLIEHVRSHRKMSGLVMDFLNPIWLGLNGQSCNMNRRTEALLEEGGFQLKEVVHFKIFAPGLPAFPMRWIQAQFK